MSSLDPLRVMFHVIKIITVIGVIVIFVFLFNSLQAQLKYDDLERYSIELREDMLSSRLTASKYIFDAAKLDAVDQTNAASDAKVIFDFLKTCDYDYFVHVEDMNTGKEWEFGYKPYDSLIMVDNEKVFNKKTSIIFAGVMNEGKANIARLDLTVYGTMLGRLSCAAEKAYQLREVQTLSLPHCFLTDFSYPTSSPANTGNWPCVSMQKIGQKSCFVARDSQGDEFPVVCRPNDVDFNELTLYYNPETITFYPIKEGSDTNCGYVDITAVAGRNDKASKVLVCPQGRKLG